jgi:hypothetical protein
MIDLHLGYEFNTGNPLLGDDEVYVNVKNHLGDGGYYARYIRTAKSQFNFRP